MTRAVQVVSVLLLFGGVGCLQKPGEVTGLSSNDRKTAIQSCLGNINRSATSEATGADFSQQTLTQSFDGQDLKNTNFLEANLKGSSFARTIFNKGTNFIGANMQAVKAFDYACALALGVQFSSHTILPKAFNPLDPKGLENSIRNHALAIEIVNHLTKKYGKTLKRLREKLDELIEERKSTEIESIRAELKQKMRRVSAQLNHMKIQKSELVDRSKRLQEARKRLKKLRQKA